MFKMSAFSVDAGQPRWLHSSIAWFTTSKQWHIYYVI